MVFLRREWVILLLERHESGMVENMERRGFNRADFRQRNSVRSQLPGLLAWVGLFLCVAALSPAAASPSAAVADPATPSTSREFFNAGTQQLRDGKLREAEAFLETVLARQESRLQP